MREPPAVINGVLLDETYAIRLSEVVSVTFTDSKPHPYRITFKSGVDMLVSAVLGTKIIAALAGAS